MKIISKYKDFYDFFITEQDPMRVWIRNQEDTGLKITDLKGVKGLGIEGWRHFKWYLADFGFKWIRLFICNKIWVCVIDKEGRLYWEFEKLPDSLKSKMTKYKWERPFKFEITDCNVNTLLDCPVILENDGGWLIKNPKLSDLWIKSVLTPKDLYLSIYDFLAPKEIITDSDPKNIDRFISKGFDKKTSFRNIK